jgi:hypothetical protein
LVFGNIVAYWIFCRLCRLAIANLVRWLDG